MRYFYMLLVLVLSGCGSQQQSIHVKVAGKLAMEFMTKVKKSDGLTPFCYGGAMMGDIQKINLGFETDECMDKDEMRYFIIQKGEELIDAMNNNLEIRPYLHDYPCTVENIHLSIIYEKKGKKNVKYPHVMNAQIIRGEIIYGTYEAEPDWFIKDSGEKYEDALKIVYGESRSGSCEQMD